MATANGVSPKVGALAVVTTRVGYAAHVGFVAGVNPDGSIELGSGNWGRRVADATVSRRLLVAVRRCQIKVGLDDAAPGQPCAPLNSATLIKAP